MLSVFSTLFELIIELLYYPFRCMAARLYKFNNLTLDAVKAINGIYLEDKYIPSDYSYRVSSNGVIIYHSKFRQHLMSSLIVKKQGMLHTVNVDLKSTIIYNEFFETLEKYCTFKTSARFFYDNGKVTETHISIHIMSKSVELSVNLDVGIYLDIQLNASHEITRITKCYRNITGFYDISVSSGHNVSLMDDVFLALLYYQSQNPVIRELLPEINIPSAYDFNSDEFNGRLQLASIIEF
jgi:hypothetical protein